jgi:hypothetical protein
MNTTHINKCSNVINNCIECENENTCSKCENDFYMINDDTKNCIEASNIQIDEYYLQKNTTMLYSCNNSNYNDIQNCKKCTEKKSCSLCKDNFTFINKDKSICVEIKTLENKYIKDPNDESNYIQCHSLYENCDTCNNINCLTCNEDYTFLNGDLSKCVAKSSSQTNLPTNAPTIIKTNTPTNSLTNVPTNAQTNSYTKDSTNKELTNEPTNINIETQKNIPTNLPTNIPTNKLTNIPTNVPTDVPTNKPTNIPTNIPTNVVTDTSIKNTTIPTEEPKTNIPTNVPNNTKAEEENTENIKDTSEIPQEEAEKMANIFLSYDEINNFVYNKAQKTINFDLYVITLNERLTIGNEIKVNANLIHNNGTRDSFSTVFTCKVQNLESNRAKFLCTNNNMNLDYYSLRYNNSVNISGVPDDEILLDPILTKKYKTISEQKNIPVFTYESIKYDECKSTGVFTILGKFSEKINESKKFNLPLTYPEGITLACEVNKGEDQIKCKVDREINNNNN